jgi:toxin ParE1/3/4
MKRFIFGPDAAQDLDDIWQYIAEGSVNAADRFIERLYENILKLADTPEIGHTREDLTGDRVSFFGPLGIT